MEFPSFKGRPRFIGLSTVPWSPLAAQPPEKEMMMVTMHRPRPLCYALKLAVTVRLFEAVGAVDVASVKSSSGFFLLPWGSFLSSRVSQ